MTEHPLREAAQAYLAVVRSHAASMSETELVEALTGLQEARNIQDATETMLLAELSRIEHVWAEDGTLQERRHPFGRQDLGTVDLVAPCLGVSHHVAASRLTDMSRILRTPLLMEEMAAGRLDRFRASIVADELVDASTEVAHEVVELLVARFTRLGGWVETAGPLRRRTAAVLERVDSTVIAERDAFELGRRGLFRRVESTRLDRWDGVYPVEDSRRAFALVDERARAILAAGGAETLAQARADAHVQLILGQSKVVLHVHVATSSEMAVEPAAGSQGFAGNAIQDVADESVVLHGFGVSGETVVPRSWLQKMVATGEAVRSTDLTCDPVTGALIGGRVPKGLAAHARPVVEGPPRVTGSTERSQAASAAYRPSAELRRLVSLRDGHCRFPGCSVTIRQCDLDHVRPWPTGLTTQGNLMALCRRHHRLKQSPGWQVRLLPDARVEWTDPIGRVRTSCPIDHLGATLPERRPAPPSSAAEPGPLIPARGWHSTLPDLSTEDLPYDMVDHSPLVEWLERLLKEAAADPSLCDPSLIPPRATDAPRPRSWDLTEAPF